jgi:hypothetical protein
VGSDFEHDSETDTQVGSVAGGGYTRARDIGDQDGGQEIDGKKAGAQNISGQEIRDTEEGGQT